MRALDSICFLSLRLERWSDASAVLTRSLTALRSSLSAFLASLASRSSSLSDSSVTPALSSLTAAAALSDELPSSIGPSSSESDPALNDASESESISSFSESSESSELASTLRPSLDLRRVDEEPLPPLARFLPFCERQSREGVEQGAPRPSSSSAGIARACRTPWPGRARPAHSAWSTRTKHAPAARSSSQAW